MILPRYYDKLDKYLEKNKVLVIYGPRRVGKTTLLNKFLQQTSKKWLFIQGDLLKYQEILSSKDLDLIRDLVEGYEIIAIDEARYIPHIGENLKIIVDNIPNIFVIATGSSSFELSGQIGEPLTGRKTTLTIYPLSLLELYGYYKNKFILKDKLEDFLRYGLYPEVFTKNRTDKKRKELEEIVNSYLLKDVFEIEKIKSPKTILNLLRLLAFQIGQQVSFSELASQLMIDKKTVARYLDILEKTFIIFSLGGFSRDLRKEIVKKSKYYFWDLGIRNAVISNFNPLNLRTDTGQLWENFIIIERMKKRAYKEIYANQFFWRTWDKKEIDLVEEREGKLFSYEIKWTERGKKISPPKDWMETYPEAKFKVINRDNYLEFIL